MHEVDDLNTIQLVLMHIVSTRRWAFSQFFKEKSRFWWMMQRRADFNLPVIMFERIRKVGWDMLLRRIPNDGNSNVGYLTMSVFSHRVTT